MMRGSRGVRRALATGACMLVSTGAGQRDWRVSDRPLLELGAGDQPAEAFHQVTSVALVQGGNLAVASVGSKDLRIFEANGRFRRAVGRDGEGPGEFRYPAWVGRWIGDSIAVWDANLQRLSIFDAAGTHGRIVRPTALSGYWPAFTGAFDDGSFVIASGTDVAALRRTGVIRQQVVYTRFAPDGALLDTLAAVQGSESYVHFQGSRMHYAALPFGVSSIVAVGGDRFYIADSGAGTIRMLDRQGRPLGTVRVPAEGRAVTRADWRRLRDIRLARLVRDDGSVGRLFADAPMPARYPAFDAFIVDAEGLLWIRRFTFPGEPARWEIYDTAGRALGALRLPPDLSVTAIGVDHILARARGEDDIDVVRLYRLMRPVARSGG